MRAAGDVGPIYYIVGLNYAADDTRVVAGIDIPYSTSAYPLGASPATLIDANNASLNQHFNTQAVFGNLDYHLTDRLTIRGAIRYTAADLHYDACSTAATVTSAAASTLIVNSARRGLGLAPIPALQIGQCTSLNPDTLDTSRYFSKLNQENVSWRTGVDFKPTSSSLLYVSVSKGFKAGSG